MIQVLDEDQDGDLTLYEMSPAQPILPVIVEAVAIDDTNTYKIQITHIQTNTITEAEIVTSGVSLQETAIETSADAPPVACANRKRRVKANKRSSKAESANAVTPLASSGAEVTIASDPSNLLACLVCGRNFVSTGRLQSHEKTHTKSRPFKCIDCGKTFTVRYSLICHTRVHTRERPYSCNLCGSRFSQASSLKTHQIYKHTKEFPYICKFCGRGFISPGQKHEHVSRSHLKSNNISSKKGKKKKANANEVVVEETVIQVGEPVSQSPEMLTACVQTNLSLPPSTIF